MQLPYHAAELPKKNDDNQQLSYITATIHVGKIKITVKFSDKKRPLAGPVVRLARQIYVLGKVTPCWP